jgi:heptosyltransferase-3
MFGPMLVAGPSDAVDFSTVRSVLVTKLRHHGDVLLASPVFTVLERFAPHVEIDALVYAETAPLLERHPSIRHVHAIPRNADRTALERARAEWSMLTALRARRFDLLVHLTDHRRGAWLARVLSPRYAVAPRAAGAPRFWKRSFTHLYPAPRGRPRHTVELNLDALRRIGVPVREADKALVLVPGEEAEARADALCREHGLDAQRFALVHPGSRWLFKTLPARDVADVVTHLERRGLRIVVTGSPEPAERAYVASVLAAVRPDAAIDLTGALSLVELAALIARAAVFVGVDSAPMHIAAAMGTPTVAAFGPSGDREWAPWRVPHAIVASDRFPCRPCGNDGCGGGKLSECLTSLGPEPVLRAVDLALAGELPRAG